jgi:cysteinyl-tRNA synthetase
MSKSIGNLVLVEDVLKEYDAQVLRYLLLTHHYRQSWEFEHSLLDMAATKWAAIQNSLAQPDSGDFAKVYEALDDDLHTERALELMHEMSGQPLRTSLALLGFVV